MTHLLYILRKVKKVGQDRKNSQLGKLQKKIQSLGQEAIGNILMAMADEVRTEDRVVGI